MEDVVKMESINLSVTVHLVMEENVAILTLMNVVQILVNMEEFAQMD
jgi:hypothetical protein